MQKKIYSFMIAALITGSFISCGDSTTKTETVSNADSMKMAEDNMATKDDKMTTEQGVMVGGSMMVPSKDIVDNAGASSDHTTLVAAVTAAGLVETLKGAGPFTVFAPTNEAFNKLPSGTVDNLLKPEMKNDLTGVLTYHVVSGAMKAADIKDGQVLKTVQGGDLKVSVKDGKVMINGANVTTADVISSNGVTHVIDAVVMPKK